MTTLLYIIAALVLLALGGLLGLFVISAGLYEMARENRLAMVFYSEKRSRYEVLGSLLLLSTRVKRELLSDDASKVHYIDISEPKSKPKKKGKGFKIGKFKSKNYKPKS